MRELEKKDNEMHRALTQHICDTLARAWEEESFDVMVDGRISAVPEDWDFGFVLDVESPLEPNHLRYSRRARADYNRCNYHYGPVIQGFGTQVGNEEVMVRCLLDRTNHKAHLIQLPSGQRMRVTPLEEGEEIA